MTGANRHPSTWSRRELLQRCCGGFGGVALSSLMAESGFAGIARAADNPLAPRPTHFPARAERVIFLYMDGGPSQVDTFDPKPRLTKENGQPIGMKIPKTQFEDVGNVLASPWKFNQYGESGLWISDLFPHLSAHADDLCVVRSMTSKFPEHTNANYFLHTGSGLQGRPSMGSWLTYGLGSECQDLPGFVVLNGGLIPPGGLDNFNSGYLPASFQGSIFKNSAQPVANLTSTRDSKKEQRAKLDLLGDLDEGVLGRSGGDEMMEAAIKNYELAFRMQTAVPELMDISGETDATRDIYGLEAKDPHTRSYGTMCLFARRLVERGVRFIELTCPSVGHDRWDQHQNLKKGHEDNARAVDKGISGLLRDLKARGLLDSTLVVFSGEFGRTPMAQGTDGRDHNPHGFSMWMAGGGVKAGQAYGATDEYGYYAIENKMEMHDLHATMLHLLGLDHTKLTRRFNSRDMRLTDVHGHVFHDLIS
ncbi:MAG: DUF1501 domain-containing protein [Planctomycetota bacterium]|nr:DUF1501 domain-containing protein [Planctomycetota bacterium]